MNIFNKLPDELQSKIINENFMIDHKNNYHKKIKKELLEKYYDIENKKIDEIFNNHNLNFSVCLEDFIYEYNKILIKDCEEGFILHLDLNEILFILTCDYSILNEDNFIIQKEFIGYNKINIFDICIFINDFINEVLEIYNININDCRRGRFLEILDIEEMDEVNNYKLNYFFGS